MPAQRQPSNNRGAWLGWTLVGGIVLVVILSTLGSSPSSQAPLGNSDLNVTASANVPTSPSVQLPPVDPAAVNRATKHLKLALDAEGFPGAMVYSQNCFASLTSGFSWAKLDQCEAFDALAQLAISQSPESGTEATYFAKGDVETRFSKVASQHQGEVISAQTHLSELTQAALARITDLQTPDTAAATLGNELSNEAVTDAKPGASDGAGITDSSQGLPMNNSE